MSFPKNNQFRDFIHHLSDNYQLKKLATYTSNTSKQFAMTIDGIPVLPIRPTKSEKHSNSDQLQKDSTNNNKNKKKSNWAVPGHSDPDDLINVMSRKMLLATMVLICSVLNMVVVLSMELMQTEKLRDAQTIWVCMLIVFDMLVTALMLYLQFTFNHHLYGKMCSKLDLMWMKVVLKIVRCCWVREHQHQHLKPMLREEADHMHTAPMMAMSIAMNTKSSSNSGEVVTEKMEQDDGIEIVVSVDDQEEKP